MNGITISAITANQSYLGRVARAIPEGIQRPETHPGTTEGCGENGVLCCCDSGARSGRLAIIHSGDF